MMNTAPCLYEPCDELKEVQNTLKDHEKRLSRGDTSFAVIEQKLDNISSKLDKKDKFNSGIISSAVNAVLGIMLGYIAIKLGLQ